MEIQNDQTEHDYSIFTYNTGYENIPYFIFSGTILMQSEETQMLITNSFILTPPKICYNGHLNRIRLLNRLLIDGFFRFTTCSSTGIE
jgi:hypothetical protein